LPIEAIAIINQYLDFLDFVKAVVSDYLSNRIENLNSLQSNPIFPLLTKLALYRILKEELRRRRGKFEESNQEDS